MNKKLSALLGLSVLSLQLAMPVVSATQNQQNNSEAVTHTTSSTTSLDNSLLESSTETTLPEEVTTPSETPGSYSDISDETMDSSEEITQPSSDTTPDSSTEESNSNEEKIPSLDWTQFDQLNEQIIALLADENYVKDDAYHTLQTEVNSTFYQELLAHSNTVTQERINDYLSFLQTLMNNLSVNTYSTTAALSGWQVENGQKVYYDASGQKVTGLVEIEGEKYYFSKEGYLQIGWVLDNGSWYYFSPEGKMQTGWLLTNGKWYHLDGTGKMNTGWLNKNGTWYYLHHLTGEMLTGWLNLGGTWYFLQPITGEMKTGWVNTLGTWYYFARSGAMLKNWQYVNGSWYYLHPKNGNMLTNWRLIGNKWYYLNPSGNMAVGWLKLGATWYYLNPNGDMKIGWLTLGGNKFYLQNSGAMVTGNVYVNNIYYHFNPSGYFVDEVWKSPSGGIQPNLAGRKNLRIDVSLSKQRVYIYEGNTMIYFMVCSTGLPGMDTPKGQFRIEAEKGPVFGGALGGARYYRSFLGHGVYLFHSATIDGAGNYIVSEGRKMGQKASHGCIRLPVPDAIWFYNQIPYGTPVSIHD